MEYEQFIRGKMAEAELKAWESLAGYKFIMFGYHASRWINYREILQERKPNPFTELVKIAQEEVQSLEI